MAQLTERYEIKLTKQDYEMLVELRKYKVCPAKFVRIAISEKMDRDYKQIRANSEKLVLRKIKDIYF